ncbi:MAG: hypothetical protein ABIK28_15875, partial [Planctomycetota bacterium]
QQQLNAFFAAGKSIYVEGTDFGYFMKATAFYQKFGCTYVADGGGTNNVQNLTGQTGTLMEGGHINYTYGTAYPDQYVDEISSNGGVILFKCQADKGRAVAFAGGAGTYRAIHSTFWLGAMKDTGASHTKAEIMQAYMNYLSGDTLVVGLTPELSAAAGGKVPMFLENERVDAGRTYAVVGSVTGTNPGWPVGSVVIPINYDIFTEVVIGFWNIAPFVNFQSTLDTQGRAMATLDYSGTLDPGAVGAVMNYAFVLAGPFDTASNAVAVPIVP